MSNIETIVIVGAGQAGASAVLELRGNKYAGKIILIGDEAHLPYERPPLSKDVILKPEETKIEILSEQKLAELGVETIRGNGAVKINPDAKTVELQNGDVVAYDKLRYRMMPYMYSMAGAVHFKDYTMMRPLVMDFNGDNQVYDIKNQWMFGPSLMACPVGEYKARSRKVYLPKQRGWYDLYTNKYYVGGQTIDADAPYDKIPVFVPEGADRKSVV